MHYTRAYGTHAILGLDILPYRLDDNIIRWCGGGGGGVRAATNVIMPLVLVHKD